MNSNDSKKADELVSYLALLSLPKIGPGALQKLVRAFGSASSALERSVAEYVEEAGLQRSQASTIQSELNVDAAQSKLQRINEFGWNIYLDSEPDYPGPLLEISGRPPLLFTLGELQESDIDAVAIVGSRMATDQGKMFARKLAGDLARRAVTVVSGMARGIDRAAHQGCIEAGGRTIAVLGCSLDYRFSPSDRKLLESIVENGSVVSEFPPGTPTLPEHFPRRNRIISGLSQAVVVVEAGARSGALLTGNNALEQNRELFSVPGFPGRPQSIGTNRLIRDGAHLCAGVEDIFDRLPRLKRQVNARQTLSLKPFSPEERQIIESVTEGPQQIDALSVKLGLTVSEVMPTLLALELKGVVRELSGKRFALSE